MNLVGIAPDGYHSAVLNLLNRRKPLPVSPSIQDQSSGTPQPRTACALSTCLAGTRATVVTMGCGEVESCRLRALGLREGASVSVVRSLDCTLLEVHGTRLAVGSAIASDITVLPA